MFRARLAGWLLVVLVAGGVAFRWSTTTTPVSIALVGVIGLLLAAPMVVLGIVAWRHGGRALRVAATFVLLGYLLTFGNLRAVVGCGSGSAPDEIRIYSHNVYLNQGDPAQVAQALVASDADVAVLVEVWPDFLDSLAAEAGVDAYRYRVSEPAWEPAGIAIWSRWPLGEGTAEVVGRRPMVQTRVDSPSGPFTLVAVHASAPREPAEIDDWQTQLDHLGSLDRSRPTVLAGDFNATIDHAQFRRLLESGWSDVHTTKGCGFDLTWPTGWGTGVALMRLDHVLVTDHFEVLGLSLGEAAGSDHRSLTSTVRLRSPSAPAREAAPSGQP